MSAYTFADVLLEPQYSEVTSRSLVDTSSVLAGIRLNLPLISANMADITGPKMAIEMAKNGGMGILHRFCSIDDAIKDYLEVVEALQGSGATPAIITEGQDLHLFQKYLPVGVSVGIKDEDKIRTVKLYEAGARIFCIDIAHGHSLMMKNMLKFFKDQFGNLADKPIVIAGNVATAQGAKDLYDWGADIVKCGIGPGCFTPNMKTLTSNGYVSIKDLKNGDMVYSHDGELHEVINTIRYLAKEDIFVVNDIECTKHHEFYVVDKIHKENIDEKNVHLFAKWVSACDLNMDQHFLVELSDE